MAGTFSERDIFAELAKLNPYGGNRDAGAEAELDKIYRAQRENLGASEEQAQGVVDSARRGFAPDTLVGRAANDWADAGRKVLGLSREERADKHLTLAREQGLQTRAAQMDLLNTVANNRGDVTSSMATMANDDLLRQAAMAQSRGIDPGLVLSATARSGVDLGQRAMAGRTQEAASRQAALQEGTHGIRSADLQRSAMEQQTLEGDLAFQQAKEDLYLKHIQQSMAQLATARGSEIDLAKIQAGGKPDFDWGGAVLPGLTQMASLGLMGLGSLGGKSAADPWASANAAKQSYMTPGSANFNPNYTV